MSTPVPAATIMVVRDGSDGIEVFMLRRHLDSDFVGGAYVFPGGKVDERDRAMDSDLVDDDSLVDGGFRVAAIRETFEEAGILLATGDHDLDPADAEAARRRLGSRSETWDWRPWLRERGVRLALRSLGWWSWWVTPEGSHRRFDTRFYIAEAPAGARAVHDGVETTDSSWVTPVAALEAAASGSASIILPTRKNLEGLLSFSSAHEAVDATRRRADHPLRIEPEIVTVDGDILIHHPSFAEPERF